jgi:hypothetical protein
MHCWPPHVDSGYCQQTAQKLLLLLLLLLLLEE